MRKDGEREKTGRGAAREVASAPRSRIYKGCNYSAIGDKKKKKMTRRRNTSLEVLHANDRYNLQSASRNDGRPKLGPAVSPRRTNVAPVR